MAASHSLYHVVPKELAGGILYPLHRLARQHPGLAEQAAKKYAGREHLMDVVIPVLNCRWNDVLHLTPLHPSKTREALEAAGFSRAELRFFVIPPARLASGQAVLFQNSRDTGGRYDFQNADFTAFDPDTYRESSDVPDAQTRYFAEMKRRGERPLLWARTPHVFYRGKIDVGGLETIVW